jgi:hypothetical protein
MDRDARIWWGEITSQEQAREIIAWAAWSLLLIGVAPVASLFVSGLRGEIALARPFWENRGDNWYVMGQAMFVTVVIVEAVLLLRSRSWVAALMLFMCCGFVVALVLATIFRLGSGEALTAAAMGQNLLLIACLMFFTHLVWRAMSAAYALPRLQLVEHFA